jgi:SAM-dependent methyltransferase
MHSEHLHELIAVERTYWWHIAKRALVTDILLRDVKPPARLIEGGVGGGQNLLTFQKLGYRVTGFDIMPEAVAHCRRLGINDVRIHDLEKSWPVESGSIRTVVLLDVLEHLVHPVRALHSAAETLVPNGSIIVTVPACPFLTGPWDQMLGHYRRYTPKLLREHAFEAGLRVIWLSYWNAFSLPAAVLVRAAQACFHSRATPEFPSIPSWFNSLLIHCARMERYWIRGTPIPLGLSLIGMMAK